jgi:hypothetical protein
MAPDIEQSRRRSRQLSRSPEIQRCLPTGDLPCADEIRSLPRASFRCGFGADKSSRHGGCCTPDQAGDNRLRLFSSSIKEGRIMSKATRTLLAAVAALTLSGGAFAQAAGGPSGGGSSGSTASPSNQMNQTNQMNGATSGYGTPGATNSDSGMAGKSPNSGLPSANSGSTSGTTSAPKSNNTLATPSVVSPAGGQ